MATTIVEVQGTLSVQADPLPSRVRRLGPFDSGGNSVGRIQPSREILATSEQVRFSIY